MRFFFIYSILLKLTNQMQDFVFPRLKFFSIFEKSNNIIKRHKINNKWEDQLKNLKLRKHLPLEVDPELLLRTKPKLLTKKALPRHLQCKRSILLKNNQPKRHQLKKVQRRAPKKLLPRKKAQERKQEPNLTRNLLQNEMN